MLIVRSVLPKNKHEHLFFKQDDLPNLNPNFIDLVQLPRNV